MKLNKLKTYTCKYCRNTNESIGIIQLESHFYSVNLSTEQWKDFHGDENVESQEFFCLDCNKKINPKIANKLIG